MNNDSPEKKFYSHQHKLEIVSREEKLNFNTDIKVIYNGRDHSFSSSSLRKRVAEGEK